MKNIVFSTKNIDEVINDIANEVVKKIDSRNTNTNIPHEQKEQLLTVQETAAFLNLSVPTIYSKVSKGELPFMKRSRRLYFSNIELIDYVKKGRIKTNEEIEEEVETYLSKK